MLVGLSGGSDSVALTLLLRDLAAQGDLVIAALAHLNHQLRPAAAADEGFCRNLALRLELPLEVESVDVRAYAASNRLSPENAARRLRYDFLDRAAVRCGADFVAVAHTEDDQAETFLMKLVRGAGSAGLGAIYPRRGRVVRPVIEISRADLRSFLLSRGESWVEDETNADTENPRNLVRHRVLPELDRVLGTPSRPAIARAAAIVRDDGEWLDQLGDRRFAELCSSVPGRVEIDADRLRAEPAAIVRRVVLRGLRLIAGGRQVDFEHVRSAIDVLDGAGRGVDVPGGRAELRGRKLVLLEQGGAPQW